MDKIIDNVDELIKKKENIYNELFKLLKTKKKILDSNSNTNNENIIIDEKFKNLKD